ncbi:MAG: purple acid phosphatase family protein [Planctomycetota bacterium]|jgi:hypothetical protein
MRSALKVPVALLALAGAARAAETKFAIRAGPYLQNPSGAGMTVMWVTTAPGTGSLEYGTTKRLGSEARASNTAPDICMVRLDGLRPGRRYYYRVTAVSADGDEARSEFLSFKVFSPRKSVVSAVIFNDIHSRRETFRALAARVEGSDRDLVFLNGDCWQDPRREQRDTKVLGDLATYAEGAGAGSRPMVLARGNHEYRGSYSPRMAELFDAPMLDRDRKIGEQKWYFAFTQGPVRFVVLDCGEDFEKRIEVFQPCRKVQGEWLEDEVASDAFRNAPFRVLVMHMPIYITTASGTPSPRASSGSRSSRMRRSTSRYAPTTTTRSSWTRGPGRTRASTPSP